MAFTNGLATVEEDPNDDLFSVNTVGVKMTKEESRRRKEAHKEFMEKQWAAENKPKEMFDVETIVSTYSNIENHPNRVVEEGKGKGARRRARKEAAEAEELRKMEEASADSGHIAAREQQKVAFALGAEGEATPKGIDFKPDEAMGHIKLSKGGIPLGVLGDGEKWWEGDGMGPEGAERGEEEDDEERERGPCNKGVARARGECPEERAERKKAQKAEKQAAKDKKRETKAIYKSAQIEADSKQLIVGGLKTGVSVRPMGR